MILSIASSGCVLWLALVIATVLLERSIHGAAGRDMSTLSAHCVIHWSKRMPLCAAGNLWRSTITSWLLRTTVDRASVVGCCRLRKQVVLVGWRLYLVLIPSCRCAPWSLSRMNTRVRDGWDPTIASARNLNLNIGSPWAHLTLTVYRLSNIASFDHTCDSLVCIIKVLSRLVHHLCSTVVGRNGFSKVNILSRCTPSRTCSAFGDGMNLVIVLSVTLHAFYQFTRFWVNLSKGIVRISRASRNGINCWLSINHYRLLVRTRWYWCRSVAHDRVEVSVFGSAGLDNCSSANRWVPIPWGWYS